MIAVRAALLPEPCPVDHIRHKLQHQYGYDAVLVGPYHIRMEHPEHCRSPKPKEQVCPTVPQAQSGGSSARPAGQYPIEEVGYQRRDHGQGIRIPRQRMQVDACQQAGAQHQAEQDQQPGYHLLDNQPDVLTRHRQGVHTGGDTLQRQLPLQREGAKGAPAGIQ